MFNINNSYQYFITTHTETRLEFCSIKLCNRCVNSYCITYLTCLTWYKVYFRCLIITCRSTILVIRFVNGKRILFRFRRINLKPKRWWLFITVSIYTNVVKLSDLRLIKRLEVSLGHNLFSAEVKTKLGCNLIG